VDADNLAGTYEYKPHQNAKVTPLIAGCNVQLHTQEGTINSNYWSALRKIASYSSMKKHLISFNKWNEQTFDYIDWPAHGILVRKQYYRKHFMTKYIHDWLPLGTHISQYKPHYTSKCPSCPHPEEDRHHFLTCPERQEWHSFLAKDLREFFRTHPTRPALAAILLEALQLWLSDQQVIIAGYPSLYSALISKQYSVGWDQVLFGRFVLEWAELQETFLSTISNRKAHHSGKTWVSGVNQIIWKHVYDTWEIRNATKHGIDAGSRESALVEMARKETAALYDVRDQVLPRDYELFYHSLDEHHLQEPTSRGLNQWLRTWQPVIHQSVKAATKLGTRGLASIRRFMLPTAPTLADAENP
jgi:hypothetical protein